MMTRFTPFVVAALGVLSGLVQPVLADDGGGVGGEGRQPKEPTKVSETWIARCAECHGANAGGVEGKAKSLLTDAAFDEAMDKRFFESLRQGGWAGGAHSTPAIEAMNDRQAWALIVYLRELQSKDWRNRVGDPKADSAGVYPTQRAKFKVETVIESAGDRKLSTPWSIEWLPETPANKSDPAKPALVLVTEIGRTANKPEDAQPAHLNIYDKGQFIGEVTGLPKITSRGQGGLMDVAAHPDYAKNGWIYLSYAEASADGKREMTKIVRGKLAITEGAEGGLISFTEQQVIFQPRPDNYNGPGVHYGSRIVFQKPGTNIVDAKGRYYIYFSIGERGGMEQAQQLDRPNGKNHRLWDDGTVPSDNPYALNNEKGVYTSIWSKGHRNQQGVCFDDNGNLFVTEHGPRGGDELNLITKGGNYGWPQVCFGMNYQDTPFVTPWKEKATDGTALTMPVHRWLPSIAACGLDCARAANVKGTFPEWSGDLFAGGLAGETVQRLRVKDGKLVESEEIVHGKGRIRDVAFGPEGYLYIVLNSPDKVVRLVPVK